MIVDYLQLMDTDQRGGRQSPYERVSEISRELNSIGEETGAVILCCAQLNRGSEHREGKRPAVSNRTPARLSCCSARTTTSPPAGTPEKSS